MLVKFKPSGLPTDLGVSPGASPEEFDRAQGFPSVALE